MSPELVHTTQRASGSGDARTDEEGHIVGADANACTEWHCDFVGDYSSGATVVPAQLRDARSRMSRETLDLAVGRNQFVGGITLKVKRRARQRDPSGDWRDRIGAYCRFAPSSPVQLKMSEIVDGSSTSFRRTMTNRFPSGEMS